MTEKAITKGTQKYQIRVCSWNGGAPVLEKRILALHIDGVFYPYKAMGINLDDFNLIMENKEKIFNALKQPMVSPKSLTPQSPTPSVVS